ncbi:hypothetical protein SJ897_09040, partial [Enterococcus faecium]
LSQNEVHSDPDLILYNPSVLIDKEPIFIKHEKLFFEIAPCDSELNGRLTTSDINGVQSTDPRY